MLATCVKMQMLTLNRLRATKATPPYWLAGEYAVLDGQKLLVDAETEVPIEGPGLDRHSAGDLIRLEVTAHDDQKITFRRVELVRKADPSLPPTEHAIAFPLFMAEIRGFFLERGLVEVQTPTLVPCPGLEPSLEPFAVRATHGKVTRELFLPTSPEISLKKAMAMGLTDLFEIKPCFRRGEFGDTHDPEFTMLEWYRGFADLDLVIEDLKALMGDLVEGGWTKINTLTITDWATLFDEVVGLKLTPQTTAAELLPFVRDPHETDTFTDLFHRILIDKIEPALQLRGPLVIRRFPPEMAALAKLDEEGWADRFEFYWNGLEIANAFNEVIEPAEQRERWAREQSERTRLGTTPLPQDPEMIDALRYLPPTGGIALGLERLYMACTGLKKIGEIKLLPAALD